MESCFAGVCPWLLSPSAISLWSHIGCRSREPLLFRAIWLVSSLTMATIPDTEVLGQLLTEARNPRTEHLDQLATLDMLTVINDEDATVTSAVRAELPQIAAAVDAIAERFSRGGRLFYIGAGTSGRLGVLDASECPPTFSVPAELVQGLIAGGDRALRLSSEHSEDSEAEGARDLQLAGFAILGPTGQALPDTLVGIAASGRTPYVLGAMAYARSLRMLTVGLSCVPGSELAKAADYSHHARYRA